ncbi:hypothetical protein Q765_07710 [Flavobacterium rivuli WB 3.3-2 = DSM 21788]|uniref:Cadherin n=1 Tax=Flavobacterium rivuli WB 3.3-2 = DSM 21788 TaxID=1121895 RepID=A0A0A2M6L8_9FLAO|nr:PQQ-dependent sugar dehydrogenase [Flavobacterium rivuli]KGO87083.1 hypothetical protein Q765_07710 [Flavobacterium rivuli WB 3.3-2 = DSM 21788]
MKRKFLLPFLLFGCAAFAQTIAPVQFASGFNGITEIVHAGTSRLYVVQQEGTVRMLEADGAIGEIPFLDITDVVNYNGERGLLGLAFHPQYVTNGYFYVYYTNSTGDNTVVRYTRSTANPDAADTTTALPILTIPHPGNTNHNGGCMRFGPDGYLYISSGDGGGSGDVNGNAQNIDVLLGKMLRIDVDVDVEYGIPGTNPFQSEDGADEVWAYGLRNAWKFSFGRSDGSMWIADVGQGVIEEINKVNPANAGLNFGWRCYEGNEVYNNAGCADSNTLTFPVAEYTHAEGGCSITGGYVYTGTAYPNLQGKYFFADYCSNKIGWVNSTTPGDITWTEDFEGNFTTFAEDVNGELYIAGGTNGVIYKITDSTAGMEQFAKSGISVYPNPAHNEVFIDLKNQAVTAQLTVFDLGGKRLIQQTIAPNVNSIDTSVFQAGIYLLEINASGNKIQQKLIIN